MERKVALKLLKDLNMSLNEEIREDYFLIILKNYIEVE